MTGAPFFTITAVYTVKTLTNENIKRRVFQIVGILLTKVTIQSKNYMVRYRKSKIQVDVAAVDDMVIMVLRPVSKSA